MCSPYAGLGTQEDSGNAVLKLNHVQEVPSVILTLCTGHVQKAMLAVSGY